jgi:hypothetical protein
MSAPGYDLRSLIKSERKSNRAEQWALIHWLCRPDKRAQKRWRSAAKSLNQGKSGATLIGRILGTEKSPLKSLLAWLKTNQEPMVQVFNQWEGTSASTVRGAAAVVSMSRTKLPCSEFSTTIVEPKSNKTWSGGIVLHWSNVKDYTVLLVKGRKWKIDQRRHGKWTNISRGTTPRPKKKGSHRIHAKRKRKALQIKVNGKKIATLLEPESPMGLCLDNCTLSFESVSWH